MLEVVTTWKITLRGQVLTQSSAVGIWGLDQVAARDHEGRLYLPGSLIQGNLRHAFAELQGEDSIDDPLGCNQLYSKLRNDDFDDAKDKYYPAHISDFVIEPRLNGTLWPVVGEHVTASAAIDDRTGAAKDAALRFIDRPIRAGEEATFAGEIRYFCEDATKANEKAAAIHQALCWIEALGAEKGVGYARVLNVEKSAPTTIDWSKPPVRGLDHLAAPSLDIEIEVEDPFCVSTERINDNTFASDTQLTGPVIKGAMAWLLQQATGVSGDLTSNAEGTWSQLCRHFACIRLTSAFPALVGASARPTIKPISLVVAGDAVHDTAGLVGPSLLSGQAPAFFLDWKDKQRDLVAKHLCSLGMLQPASPLRELRVHTAIQRSKGNARDKSLYAYDCVCPVAEDHKKEAPKPLRWRGKIDLTAVPVEERVKTLEQLEAFFGQAVLRLGRTRARARIKVVGTHQQTAAPETIKIDKDGTQGWMVTLQSPALMNDPWDWKHDQEAGKQLFDAYAAYFRAASNQTLELVRFFATQKLEGGYVIDRRFRRKPNGGGDTYNPILLTDAGSVFVLKKADKADGAKSDPDPVFNQWLSGGLPLPGWTEEFRKIGANGGSPIDVPLRETNGKPLTFNDLPYLPSNGYGEIAVNLPCHLTLAPHDQVTVFECKSQGMTP